MPVFHATITLHGAVDKRLNAIQIISILIAAITLLAAATGHCTQLDPIALEERRIISQVLNNSTSKPPTLTPAGTSAGVMESSKSRIPKLKLLSGGQKLNINFVSKSCSKTLSESVHLPHVTLQAENSSISPKVRALPVLSSGIPAFG